MTNEVRVNATYQSRKRVPRIGDRKRMKVNGHVELLTLNKIEAERRHLYRDDNSSAYEYDTTEFWSAYTNVAGW